MTNYAESETRPLGQEVVIFYRETYAVRLFSTVAAAKRHFPSAFVAKKQCVFLDSDALYKSFTVTQLKAHLRELTTRRVHPLYDARDKAVDCPEHDPASQRDVARALWDVLQSVGDRVLKEPGAAKSRQKDLYKFDLAAMSSPEGLEAASKLPKQAKQVIAEIRTLAISELTEKQADELMRQMVARGALKTKQDPLRIFQFYAPAMHDLGFVEYPGRRSKSGDDEDEDEDEVERAEAA